MTTEKKIIGILVIGTVAILGGAVFFLSKGGSTSVPEDQIVARSGLHWHPKLAIFLGGQKQPFPDSIGLNGPVHNPIHTHDDANQDIIHMEFSGMVTKDQTKLSKFFQIWGKDFNSMKLLDKEASSGGVIKMTVNGEENKDFENYMMKDGDKIEVRYE